MTGKLLCVGVVSAALSACAVAPSSAANSVRDADAKMVETCRYVGEVDGSSGWGGLAASAGMENAKNAAREQAATKLGATHIVWNSINGGMAPSVSGKAYKC